MTDRVLSAPRFACFIEDWHLAPVRDTGEWVFLSGVTGTSPDGVLSLDPEQQFEDTFLALAEQLEAAGLRLPDIVEMTTYHVDLRRHLRTFVAVKDRHIVAPYPAWSAIGVSELITEGTLIEIRVIARRP